MFRNSKVEVLKWPLGKTAAFSFSNDAEYLTYTGWQTLLKVFESTLGKQNIISTSIFLQNPNPTDPAMSLSAHDGAAKLETDQIIKQIVAGNIDGLHAFGNFDLTDANFDTVNKSRKLLSSIENPFKWWSNHGGKNNKQNIGNKKLTDYQQGDLPDSRFYSLKLTRELGISYYWLDDNIVTLSNIAKSKTIVEKEVRDNSSILTFNRYRGLEGKPAPTLESLNEQVTEELLSQIMMKNSSVLVYQHLGISKRDGKEVVGVVNDESDIPDSAIETFKLIANFEKKGLWVLRTSELLDYLFTQSNIKVHMNGSVFLLNSKLNYPLKLQNLVLKTRVAPTEIYWKSNDGSKVQLSNYLVEKSPERDYLICFY